MQSSSIMEQPLKILYEDNHLIAVFKPHRMLTQGDETGDLCLMDLTKACLKEKYQKPGNVFLGLLHRLDRPVAGVVLFAKTSKGASRLSEQIRGRKFRKSYLALVEGQLKLREAKLDQWLSFDEVAKRTSVVEHNGAKVQRAIMDYKVVGTAGKNSVVKINLETGRKHQIRAQLAYLGHPVLGDSKYGATQSYAEGSIALMANEIEFSQPTTKERIVVTLDPAFYPHPEMWG